MLEKAPTPTPEDRKAQLEEHILNAKKVAQQREYDFLDGKFPAAKVEDMYPASSALGILRRHYGSFEDAEAEATKLGLSKEYIAKGLAHLRKEESNSFFEPAYGSQRVLRPGRSKRAKSEEAELEAIRRSRYDLQPDALDKILESEAEKQAKVEAVPNADTSTFKLE